MLCAFRNVTSSSFLQIKKCSPADTFTLNLGVAVHQVFHCLRVKCSVHQPLENSPAGLIGPIHARAFARCSSGTQLLGCLSRDSAAARDAFTGELIALLCLPTSGQMNSKPLN